MTGVQTCALPICTPKAVVARLHDESVKILAAPEMKDRFQNTLGGDAVGNTPEQFAANIRDDIERWGKIVKQTGLKLE